MTNRETDGTNDAIYEGEEIPLGMVVRMRSNMNDSGVQEDPFSDMLVVSVTTDPMDKGSLPQIKIARPFCYTTLMGSVLTGCETITVSEPMFRKRFMKVLSARGKPMTMLMGYAQEGK